MSHLRFHDSYKLPQKATAYVDSKGSKAAYSILEQYGGRWEKEIKGESCGKQELIDPVNSLPSY